MIYEMLTLAQRNDEICHRAGGARPAHARPISPTRSSAKRDSGVLALRVEPELAAMFLFALADGVMVRRLSEPTLDIGPLIEQAIVAARAVLS